MSMYNHLEEFQLPFDKTDLIDSGQFIRFCQLRGIKLSENILEEYERKGLLFPILRVFQPIGEYKQSPKDRNLVVPIKNGERFRGKIFYKVEGIIKLDSGVSHPPEASKPKPWFEGYDFELPIKAPFRKWSKYKSSGLNISKNKKELGTPAVNYYSFLQLHSLLHIRLVERFPVKNTTEDFTGLSKTMATILLINDFHILVRELNKNIFTRVQRQQTDPLFSRADYRSISELATQETAQEVQTILSKREVTTSFLKETAEWFITRGLGYDPASQIRTLIYQYVPEELLRNVRGVMLLAQDYYDVANLFLTLLKVLEPKTKGLYPTISELQSRLPSCIVCGNSFVSTKKGGKTQVTCGSIECKRMHNTKYVSAQRKMGNYTKQKPSLKKLTE